MQWNPNDLTDYCSSKAYHDDYAEACHPIPLKSSKRAGSYCNMRGSRNGSGSSSMAHTVTMSEFHQGIKRAKTFYQVMKEDSDGLKELLLSLK
jgi:hypothetical protein